ncbi:hypothetical protein EV650_4728 [Kribbella kalugense]|uniref:Uncharacterized protein n=1 Tax=Kribbella kalugense TaxID=2512221 RepID=A0A4R7ZK35_9ACTN|nr:hypothetical protein EV650_4728 [Kribbella kalugense]
MWTVRPPRAESAAALSRIAPRLTGRTGVRVERPHRPGPPGNESAAAAMNRGATRGRGRFRQCGSHTGGIHDSRVPDRLQRRRQTGPAPRTRRRPPPRTRGEFPYRGPTHARAAAPHRHRAGAQARKAADGSGRLLESVAPDPDARLAGPRLPAGAASRSLRLPLGARARGHRSSSRTTTAHGGYDVLRYGACRRQCPLLRSARRVGCRDRMGYRQR